MAQGQPEHAKDDPNGPGTTRTPQDNPNSQRTTRTTQGRPEHPKDNPNSAGTTQTPQEPCEPPNDGAEGRTRRWVAHHACVGKDLGPTRTGRGFGAEPCSAPFLCVVFYLVHVPRHQGGSTPSL